MKHRKTVEKTDLCFGLLLIVGIFLYLLRIQLGIPDLDESFYLTVPYRLAQGDSLLVDEWHVSQLVGFLLYPYMRLYLMMSDGTEGIYLAFRYMYLFSQTTVAVISYLLLRKRDRKLAVVSSMVFFLFTVNCVKALSYNTIGLMAVWLFVVVALTETRFFRIKHIVLGILLAAIVLCNPYMVLMYIIYMLVCVWKRKSETFFGLREWAWVTAGSVILLAVFLIFLFSRVTFTEIIKNVPYIFWDPAHEPKRVSDFIRPIIWFVSWFKLYFIFFACGSIFFLFCPKLRKLAYIGLMLLSTVLWVLLVIFKSAGIGKHAIMLPLTLLGGLVFVLTKEKSWDLFQKGWITGIIYAFCMNLSSNQGIYVICNACTISSCISLFLIKDYFEENKEWTKSSCWIAGLAAMQLLAEIYVNLNYVWGEDEISCLTYKITQGPFKGIYTTEEKGRRYNVNYTNIKSLGNIKDKNFVCFNWFPCGYLIAEGAESAAYSAWQTEYRRLDDERIVRYYELHPEKIPDIIYFDLSAVLDWPEEEQVKWCETYGYVKHDFSEGGSVLLLE